MPASGRAPWPAAAGTLLLEAEFRMSMGVAPPAGQIVMNLRDAGYDLDIRSSDGYDLSERPPPTASATNR
jgi:hypothetical protein